MKLETIRQRYDQVRSQLQTLDLVLFSGKGRISQGIKFGTRSRWSHVGMVVVSPELGVLLAESTTLSDVPDIVTGEAIKGVQLVLLLNRLQAYRGDVAIRHLLDVERDARTMRTLLDLRHEFHGRPYEKDELELIRSAYDGPGGRNTEDLQSIFCSELVAECWQRLGLLTEDVPSNEYSPADFGEDRSDKKLRLLRGRLGPEIHLQSTAAAAA